jgi:nitroreductase
MMNLEEILGTRRTVRRFTNVSVSEDNINKLLWAAQGITSPKGKRTAPSAGGLYPVSIYTVITVEEKIKIAEASRQLWISNAGVILILSAQYSKMASKYGKRGIRYSLIEIGHIAQNILLQAVALGLGAAVVGAFRDQEISKILGLSEDLTPVLIIPIGEKT